MSVTRTKTLPTAERWAHTYCPRILAQCLPVQAPRRSRDETRDEAMARMVHAMDPFQDAMP